MTYENKRKQTRTLITDTFIQLIAEKPLAKITIGDITKKAGINRSTFYQYYVDKPQLVEALTATFLEQLEQIQTKRQQQEIKHDEDWLVSMVETLELYQQHAAFLNAMLSEHGDLAFEHLLQQQTIEFTRNALLQSAEQATINDSRQEMIVQFQASAIFGLTRYWLQNQEMTATELAKLIFDLKASGLHLTTNEPL